MLGLLRVRVIRGVNLAVRDLRSSDPYVVLRMGKQKLKTDVYDKDTFSFDDPMGHAEFDIQPFVESVKMRVEGVPSNTLTHKVMPCRSNCLAEESKIYFCDGKIVQDIVLRLRDVGSAVKWTCSYNGFMFQTLGAYGIYKLLYFLGGLILGYTGRRIFIRLGNLISVGDVLVYVRDAFSVTCSVISMVPQLLYGQPYQ